MLKRKDIKRLTMVCCCKAWKAEVLCRLEAILDTDFTDEHRYCFFLLKYNKGTKTTLHRYLFSRIIKNLSLDLWLRAKIQQKTYFNICRLQVVEELCFMLRR